MPTATFKPQFVRAIPDDLSEGVIYISMDYRTVVHKCACGCGRQVTSALAPTGWTLSYNGTVSLHPSIGNWDFACRSHYWIRGNAVAWAEQWTDDEVTALKISERRVRDRHYNLPPEPSPSVKPAPAGFCSWLLKKLLGS